MDVVRFVRTVTQFCGTHEKRKSLKIKHKQQQGNESVEENKKIRQLTDGQDRQRAGGREDKLRTTREFMFNGEK